MDEILTVYKASAADIPRLIELRLDMLRQFGEITEQQETALRAQLEDYFRAGFARGDFAAMLGEANGRIVSAAYLAITCKPANLSFPTGKTGTILNVLTYPAFRRRGYASTVVAALIEEARRLGVDQLDLMATEAGRPVYEGLGFTLPHDTCMKLSLTGGRIPD